MGRFAPFLPSALALDFCLAYLSIILSKGDANSQTKQRVKGKGVPVL